MILQASEYEAAQGMDLKEFFASTAGKFKTDIGKAWAAEIVARREGQRRGHFFAGIDFCITACRRFAIWLNSLFIDTCCYAMRAAPELSLLPPVP